MNASVVARNLPIDAYLVSFSEIDHYAIKEEDRPYIQDIRGVYLFDHNQRTFCCEMTPSYWLIHLYDEVVFALNVSDEDQERLDEEYGHCGGDDIYVHCHEVDALIAAPRPYTAHHYGGTGVGYDDSDYDEQIEGLQEHFCCNHYL